VKPLFVNSHSKFCGTAFFQCELLGGHATDSIETGGAAFYREDEIPDLSLPRVTPSQIARFFDHYRHPEWPTDFD